MWCYAFGQGAVSLGQGLQKDRQALASAGNCHDMNVSHDLEPMTVMTVMTVKAVMT
jgi:hypothetical protein